MLGGAAFPPIGQLPYLLTLPPYGFYWFVLAPLARMPSWFVPAPQPLPEYVTLVLRNSLEELLAEPIRGILEKEVLPAYLPKRRWFAAKDQVLEQTRIVEVSAVPAIEPPVLLAEIEAQMPRGTERYLLPFGFVAEDAIARRAAAAAGARTRTPRPPRRLPDRCVCARQFCAPADRADRGQRARRRAQWRAAVPATDALRRPQLGHGARGAPLLGGAVQQLLDHRRPGDAEAVPAHPRRRTSGGRDGPLSHRTRLCEYRAAARRDHRVGADNVPYMLGIAQSFIYNEGDAWSWTQNLLERTVQEVLVMPAAAPLPEQSDAIGRLQRAGSNLGRRLGEMHAVLAQPSDDAAFAPQTADAARCEAWAAVGACAAGAGVRHPGCTQHVSGRGAPQC